MAATDVKDVYVTTKPNGEQWVVKKLCNGDIVDVVRICNCAGDPDDPGNSPDPIVDTEACRIANGIGSYIQGRANYFATLLGEQPDNDFGSFAVAVTWLTSTYGPLYPAQLWDATRQLAIDYNNTDEGLLGDGVPNAGQYLACAAYQAIQADVNGINLSPDFPEAFSVILTDFIPDLPNAELEYTVPFLARIVELITLAIYKRVAFEASTVDPIEAGDYECTTCFGSPDPGLCVQESYIWNQVDATPANWSTMTTLPAADFGNLQDEFNECSSFAAARTAFGNWVRSGTGIGVQCMGIRRVFTTPCLVTSVSCEFMADTGNSKFLAIAANVDGTWTVLTSLFDQAPSANPRAIQAQGEWADVSEIVFIHRNGNTTTDIHPRITKTNINIL